MEKEEKSHQWNLAYFGLAAVILGAVIAFGSSWYIWHLQQNAADEEKLLERQNIANALYVDVSSIEDKLNLSMHMMLLNTHNNTTKLDDPNYIYFTDARFYSVNWIYTAFGKEISGFDSITSAELYDFYENVAEIDDYMQLVYQISRMAESVELSRMDAATAHTYTKGLFGVKIPDCIQEAEKIKQALRQKYHVNIIITPSNKLVDTSFNLKINHTNGSRALAIDYH
jgi:hypothetical protein